MAIFQVKPSASSQVEANDAVAFASALNTCSSASLSTRVTRPFTSSTLRAALSYAVVASRAEASAAITAASHVDSTTTATSCTWVTSASSAGMSALPQDKSFIKQNTRGIKEHRRNQRNASKMFLSLQTNLNQTQNVLVD
jgi:hypothetical protein